MTEEDSKEMLDSAALNARAAIRQISAVMTQRDDLQPIVLEELHDALDGAFEALVHLRRVNR